MSVNFMSLIHRPRLTLGLTLAGLALPSTSGTAADLDTISGYATLAVLDSEPQTLVMPEPFEEPVAIFGPSTYHDCGGGVARMSWQGPASLEARYQEWEYLDGVHYAEEVDLLILESGRYTLSDGREVEVGSASVEGTSNQGLTRVDFSTRFPGSPYLFLTVQTEEGGQTISARASRVSASHFFVGLWEQESLMDGHREEQVGYLAIFDPLGEGELPLSTGSLPYSLSHLQVDSEWTATSSTWIRMEEERSEDPEIEHLAETVALMELAGLLFAQDVTSGGADPATIRRLTMCN